MIKAIETEYKGYRFRSRLEARWAVFFDNMGAKWEYEKEGFDLGDLGYYLPDFWLPFHPDYRPAEYPNAAQWIEIKGSKPTDIELAKLRELSKTTYHNSSLVVGVPGEQHDYFAHHSGLHGWRRREEDVPLPPGQWGAWMLVRRHSPFAGTEFVNQAINAATHARFEYGETPKPPSFEELKGRAVEYQISAAQQWFEKADAYLGCFDIVLARQCSSNATHCIDAIKEYQAMENPWN